MLVGVGAETDLLYDHLGGIGLHLLGFLALLVQELLVIEYLAHGRIGLCAYLHQIKTEFIGQGQCLGDGIDTRFGYIVTDETHLGRGNLLVDVQFTLFLALRAIA